MTDDNPCSDQFCATAVYARGLCKKHYTRAGRDGTLHEHSPLPPLPESCWVDGCERPRVKQARGRYRYCAAHRSRVARTGKPATDAPIVEHVPGPWLTGNGYLEISARNHPLVGSNGHARQHRVLLYESIGPGWHPCNWCERPVAWDVRRPHPDALTVDHLDHNRTNNSLENLVPSCHSCNAARTQRRSA